ncbi:MAG: DUF4124 domain-containing protein [Gammaproteobacteria bacterium]|jgi:hypothetical protein|nr:DUF4124 domain-containing protein [Gammaproteobacteria bacterium]
MKRTSLALLLALGSAPVPAALYRCVAQDGHVTYADTPCAPAAAATTIAPDPSPRDAGAEGLRPGEREMLARAYRRDDQERARHERVARNSAGELRLNQLRKRKDAIAGEMGSAIGGAAQKRALAEERRSIEREMAGLRPRR